MDFALHVELVEGELDYEDRHRWHQSMRQPLTFEGYVMRLAKQIQNLGFYVEVLPFTNRQGLRILLVGEMSCSRLIAVHPDDPRGLIYLLEDNGQSPTVDLQCRAIKAVTYTRLVEAGSDSVYAMLELDVHMHDRFDDEVPSNEDVQMEQGLAERIPVIPTGRVLH